MYWKFFVCLSIAALPLFSGCSMPTPGDAVMLPVNPMDHDKQAGTIQMSPSHSKPGAYKSSPSQADSSFAYPAPDVSNAPGELPPDSADYNGY